MYLRQKFSKEANMSEAEKIEREINDAIEEQFKKKFDCLKGYSWPFFFSVSERYTEKRLVILGQETNQWSIDKVELTKDDLREKCLKKYDKFIGGDIENPNAKTAENYRGNFWRFSKSLYKQNDKFFGIFDWNMVENSKLSHCWMNLYFLEKCKHKKDRKGRTAQNSNLASDIKEIQEDLVNRVLNVLKPSVILAVTGPTQDEYLKDQFDTIEEIQSLCDDFTPWQLGFAKATLGQHETTVIRAYHPSYFMGRINKHKDYDVSKCYREVLRDKLKEFLKI